MQCPSCGFENIPGSERCLSCSALFAARSPEESVHPPRARDRTWGQRVRWSLSGSRSLAVADERFEDLQARTSAFPQWLSLRAMGLILLSVIPGVAHCLALGDARRGRWLLLGTALALALAVLLYRFPASNFLLYNVLAVSVLSVTLAVEGLRGGPNEGSARYLIGIGIFFTALSIYLGTYLTVRLALSPLVRAVRVTQTPWFGAISENDTVLVLRDRDPNRGDIFLGASYADGDRVPVLGPVVGLPGEQIEISDDVYVNGIPTHVTLPPFPQQEGPRTATIVLAADEYWIMPAVQGEGMNMELLAEAGTVDRSDLWGRASVVIDPPAHRHRLGPQSADQERVARDAY